jgi:hypothetical protein
LRELNAIVRREMADDGSVGIDHAGDHSSLECPPLLTRTRGLCNTASPQPPSETAGLAAGIELTLLKLPAPMHFANDVAAADELAFDRHRNLGGGCHGLAGRRLAWAARRSRRACPLGRTSTDIFVIGDTAFAHDAPGEPLPGMGSPLSPSSKEPMWRGHQGACSRQG